MSKLSRLEQNIPVGTVLQYIDVPLEPEPWVFVVVQHEQIHARIRRIDKFEPWTYLISFISLKEFLEDANKTEGTRWEKIA